MQFFPHFHWVTIEGKRPLIPENFIREEMRANAANLNLNPNQPRKK